MNIAEIFEFIHEAFVKILEFENFEVTLEEVVRFTVFLIIQSTAFLYFPGTFLPYVL